MFVSMLYVCECVYMRKSGEKRNRKCTFGLGEQGHRGHCGSPPQSIACEGVITFVCVCVCAELVGGCMMAKQKG